MNLLKLDNISFFDSKLFRLKLDQLEFQLGHFQILKLDLVAFILQITLKLVIFNVEVLPFTLCFMELRFKVFSSLSLKLEFLTELVDLFLLFSGVTLIKGRLETLNVLNE